MRKSISLYIVLVIGLFFSRAALATENSVMEIRRAAERGDVIAQNNLAFAYYFGLGINKDVSESAKWWHMAAAQGNAYAEDCLGYAYHLGKGVQQDDTEAVKWWRMAAEQGDVTAQHNLGNAYHSGRGVRKDQVEAEKWWKKSPDYISDKISMVDNRANDLESLEQKAEEGDAISQDILADNYYFGAGGITKDDVEALKWRSKAAQQGNSVAQHRLGDAYYLARGVEKDDDEAEIWWHKAADKEKAESDNSQLSYEERIKKVADLRVKAEVGDYTAQYELGNAYYIGENTPKDNSEAIKWWKKAANNRDFIASSKSFHNPKIRNPMMMRADIIMARIRNHVPHSVYAYLGSISLTICVLSMVGFVILKSKCRKKKGHIKAVPRGLVNLGITANPSNAARSPSLNL